MKDTSFRKMIAFLYSLPKDCSVDIEDWDNMIAINIQDSTKNKIQFVFYEDGRFRNIAKIDE